MYMMRCFVAPTKLKITMKATSYIHTENTVAPVLISTWHFHLRRDTRRQSFSQWMTDNSRYSGYLHLIHTSSRTPMYYKTCRRTWEVEFWD